MVISNKINYQRNLAILLPTAYLIIVLLTSFLFSPVVKLILMTVGLYYIIKISSVILNPPRKNFFNNTSKFIFFFFIWPGIDTNVLEQKGDKLPKSYLLNGLSCMLLALAMVIVFCFGTINKELLGWVGIIPFFLFFHFGLSQVIFYYSRLIGLNTNNPFNNPFLANSLTDFWSKRWNQPYVEMNKLYFTPLLSNAIRSKQKVFIVIFLISGVLHELALSYPVNSGYGLPMIYFLIQLIVILLLRKFNFLQYSRITTWLTIFVPLPLLFHEDFRNEFIIKFYNFLTNL